MTFKLKYQAIEGDAYMRCHQVLIDNPLNKNPIVRYSQERVIEDGSSVIKIPAGRVSREFEPEKFITLINPETGEPITDPETGEPMQLTQEQLMMYVYSAYIDAVTPPENDEMETV